MIKNISACSVAAAVQVAGRHVKDPAQRQQLNRRAGQCLAERALPESLRLAALSAAAPGESATTTSSTCSNVKKCMFGAVAATIFAESIVLAESRSCLYVND